jgi:hypothetical protein
MSLLHLGKCPRSSKGSQRSRQYYSSSPPHRSQPQGASITIDSISTSATVLARAPSAVVNIIRAVHPIEASRTGASITIDSISTSATVLARVRGRAVIDIIRAVHPIEASRKEQV